jgi:hypothetical protein
MRECANDAAAKGLRVQPRVAALQLAARRTDVTKLRTVGVPAHRLADAAGDGLMRATLRLVNYDRAGR